MALSKAQAAYFGGKKSKDEKGKPAAKANGNPFAKPAGKPPKGSKSGKR